MPTPTQFLGQSQPVEVIVGDGLGRLAPAAGITAIPPGRGRVLLSRKSVSLVVVALTAGARMALLVRGVGAAVRDVGEHAER